MKRTNRIDESAESEAHARFRQALLDFSDAPTYRNLARYLRASDALDGSTSSPSGSAQGRLAGARAPSR